MTFLLLALLWTLPFTSHPMESDPVSDLCDQFNAMGQFMVSPEVQLLGATCSWPFFTLSFRLVDYESDQEEDQKFEASMATTYDSLLQTTREFDVLKTDKYTLGFLYQDRNKIPVAYIVYIPDDTGQFVRNDEVGKLLKEARKEGGW